MEYSDEELIAKARENDESALNELFSRYKNLVNKISRSYFLIGGDVEDLVQEGMIGLYKAIRGYSPQKTASFKTFASVCIKHQIQNAIKVASSEKNKILSSAMPILEQSDFDEDGDKVDIILSSNLASPDQAILACESVKELDIKIKKYLSSLEFKVLSLYLNGYSYNEIATIGKISKKSIDNSLTRIKQKLAFMKKEK